MTTCIDTTIRTRHIRSLPSIDVAEDCTIGDDQPCFVIAEIGQNHNGDMEIARRLIDTAATCGASAVKFCKRHIPSELTKEAYNASYVGPNSFGETYGQHREFLELSVDDYRALCQHATKAGILFFSTACDQHSVDDLEEVGVSLYKLASRDLTNLPLIDYMARTGKPIIASCGMDSRADIGHCLDTIRHHHNKIVLMHCTSSYPTAMEDVNLRALHSLRSEFNVLVGLSDHTIGIVVPVVAAAMGAVAVEKHVTLARHMKGTDHACSLEPDGLRRVLRDIRNIEMALGDGEKRVPESTIAAAQKLRRSLVMRVPLQKGDIVEESMLTLKCPGTGLLWRERHKIVGHRAVRFIEADSTIYPDDFE